MSYYRDRLNPEAVHFPAQLHVSVTYAVLLLALVVAGLLTIIYGSGTLVLTDLSQILACVAVLALYYPRTITTDETGIRIGRRFSSRQRLIRWGDVQSATERAAIPGIPAFDAGFVANWVVEIRSVLPERPIRFTGRHSGKRAFLYELKHWGAPVSVPETPAPIGPAE